MATFFFRSLYRGRCKILFQSFYINFRFPDAPRISFMSLILLQWCILRSAILVYWKGTLPNSKTTHYNGTRSPVYKTRVLSHWTNNKRFSTTARVVCCLLFTSRTGVHSSSSYTRSFVSPRVYSAVCHSPAKIRQSSASLYCLYILSISLLLFFLFFHYNTIFTIGACNAERTYFT